LGGDPDTAEESRTIAKNFAYLLAAHVVAGVAGLVSMAYLARALGPETFGILGFGVAIIAYFGHLVVLGSDIHGAREIARQPAAAGSLISRIIGFRVVTAVVAAALFLFAVWAIDQSRTVKTVMAIQGLGLLVSIFSLDFVFQGLQRMGVIATRQVIASVLVLVAVLLLIGGPGDLYAAAAIPVAATALSAAWLLVRARRAVGPLGIRLPFGEGRAMLRAVLPLAVSGAMSAIYYNTDIVMLGFLSDHRAVGLYVGAYRIFVVSLTFGSLIGAVYAPALAASWHDESRRRSDFRQFSAAMMFVGMPVAAAGIAFPREIIGLVFGADFGAAHGAFVVLMVAVVFAHVAAAGAVCLIAWNDQTFQMIVLAVGAAANIAANFLLIPLFGIVGAAGATLICQGVVAIVMLVRIHRRHGAVGLGRLARPLLCAAVAFAAARVLFDLSVSVWPHGPGTVIFLVSLAAGCMVYLGLAARFGAVDLARLRSRFVGAPVERGG
jgi:O-antigen/teichoic acid export membrane protein